MILVTGATGHLGRLVINSLRRTVQPDEIVAGVRDPTLAADLAAAGIPVRILDYDRPATVRDALADVERVLLISSSEVGRRVVQHRAVIDAAVAANVSFLAYTSILHAHWSTVSLAGEHRETEAMIVESGLPYTMLRNSWYLENYTENLRPALAHGALIGSAADGRIAAAARADYAAAAAVVLIGEGHGGVVYELAGHGFTMAELAAELSEQSGHTIAYRDLPAADHRAALLEGGLPEHVATLLVDADRGVAHGDLDAPSDTLESLIGRAPTSMRQAVSAALAGIGA